MPRFLVSIGNEGLETVLNIDEVINEDMVEKLSSNSPSTSGKQLGRILHMLHMRYRMNSHRKIKSYILEYSGSADDIWDNAKYVIKKLKKEGKPFTI